MNSILSSTIDNIFVLNFIKQIILATIIV